MSDDYAIRQAERDREYAAAFSSPEAQQWIASLEPRERQRLEAEGLLKPLIQRSGNGMMDDDLASTPLASETPDIAGGIDRAMAVPNSAPVDDERLWDVLRRLLGELLNQKNAKLTIECLAVVSGIGFMGDSMTEIARRNGVTRAAVSKRCVELTEKLGLPPSRGMRSLTARMSYARTQHSIRNHHEQRNHRRR